MAQDVPGTKSTKIRFTEHPVKRWLGGRLYDCCMTIEVQLKYGRTRSRWPPDVLEMALTIGRSSNSSAEIFEQSADVCPTSDSHAQRVIEMTFKRPLDGSWTTVGQQCLQLLDESSLDPTKSTKIRFGEDPVKQWLVYRRKTSLAYPGHPGMLCSPDEDTKTGKEITFGC